MSMLRIVTACHLVLLVSCASIDPLPSPDSGVVQPDTGINLVCQPEATVCVNDKTIILCRNDAWEEADCQSLCAEQEGGYAVGCGKAKGIDACFCMSYGKMGDLCGVGQECMGGLSCVFGMCTTRCCPGSKHSPCEWSPCPSGYWCEFDFCTPF